MQVWKESLLNANKVHVICHLFRRLHDLDEDTVFEAMLGIDAMSMEPVVSCGTGDYPVGSNDCFGQVGPHIFRHNIPEFLDEGKIIYRLIPPHTGDHLQPLDLGIFTNQTKCQGNITVDSTLNRQTRQVIMMKLVTLTKNDCHSDCDTGVDTCWAGRCVHGLNLLFYSAA